MSSEDVDELKQRGNDAYAAGSMDQAIALYSQALELDPTNPVLFSNRAAVYTEIEDYQKAKFDADMCIYLKPTWVKGYWRKGKAETEAQEYKEAIQTFEKGLEYCPTDQNLVDGKREAIKLASVIDRLVGAEHGFDIDGPSQKSPAVVTFQTASPTAESRTGGPRNQPTSPAAEDSRDWPGPLDTAIEKILDSHNLHIIDRKTLENRWLDYDMLHVPRDASPEAIKKNYYMLARMLHPDKCQMARGQDAMTDVSIAYQTLTNPTKRRQYDLYLDARQADPEGGVETYAEWEARQQGWINPPKWVQKLLETRGAVFVLVLILLVILIPLLLIILIIQLLVQCLWTLPKWEIYKEQKAEEQRRASERFDEAMQDQLHSHL